MTKPDYKNIMVQEPGGSLRVLEPVSEIIPGLWQGIRPPTYRGYDLVVSCEQFLAKGPMEGYEGMLIHIPMRDDDEFRIPVLAIETTAELISDFLHPYGASTNKVLVHCSGGLNRSSLVTTNVLMQVGHSRKEAVTVLRAKRDPFCLCNKAFERWVLGEQLPTAETSTFYMQEFCISCKEPINRGQELCRG